MENQDAQFKKMTETPIPKLVTTLAVPTVISMLITAIYNTADAYFVSKIGTSASGAVGVVFSLMAIIQAVGFTIGMGAGSMISRLLGKQENDEASGIASGALFLGLVIGILMALGASVFISDIMLLLGATETILPYAISYGKYIIYGAPVMIGAFILNNLLRAQGKAKYAMVGIGTGGILNIALDPFFIFTLNMGTAGAAIATLISQCVSVLILTGCFIFGKSDVSLSVKKIPRDVKKYLMILKTGLPSLSRQGFSSLATMFLNRSARVYGDAAVAAMSVTGKIFMIIFSVIIGIGQGFQPVVGFNFGAKKYDRVKKAFLFTFFLGTTVAIVMAVPVFVFPDWIMARFTVDDRGVIEIGRVALRLQCLGLILMPLNTVCNMTYQVIGKSWTATFLSCMRQGLFFIPLVIVLPMYFGIFGLQISQPIADFLAGFLCIPFGIKFLRDLKKSKK